ncbi:hypothetical protein [Marmoricola sp. RAF53]|uniref:hypothetical protein n=1 Tax=Marmoricola sp. RAF53 TaxID=3233059 RepID=UPI003F9A8D99
MQFQPPMPKHDPPMHLPGFYVRRRFTLFTHRYEIRAVGPDGGQGELIAIGQRKRLRLKEQVTFYADEARTRRVFSFKARQVVDVAVGYDVFDERGDAIGYFQKDFGRSLLRPTFRLSAPSLNAVGQERNEVVALARRFLFLPLAYFIDFGERGFPTMTVEREFALLDHYTVTVPDRRLDFRVAASMTVALRHLMRWW